jgi:hypothetical protein
MVLTASFMLSLVIGFLATIPAVMRQHHRPVDASVEASRPHDFAVRLTRLRQKASPGKGAVRLSAPSRPPHLAQRS